MQLIRLTIKRAFWTIFLCLALISFPQPSLALQVWDVPNPQEQYIRGWVTDMANLLESDTKLRLNQMIAKLESQNGTEIAVVTVPDTAPTPTPKEFATHLFNYWGIGKKGINNGVLFLISKNDRRVEIETGQMIDAILPNARVGEIINREIIPSFKQDKFADGILAGTQSLVLALEGQHEVVMMATNNQANLMAFVIIGFIIAFLVLAIVLTIGGTYQSINSDEDDKRKRPRSSNPGGDSGGDGGYGGDGSWGGDGGGFGGGDSGGGGDGGGW